MEFIFMPPYSCDVGERFKITIKESFPLKMLIPKLPSKVLAMLSNPTMIEDDTLGAHILFLRQGHILKPDDIITCDDIVKIMLPVTGG